MNAQKIVEIARQRATTPEAPITFEAAREAVIKACDNLLGHPNLPGDWWAEQIIQEAVRLLKETKK